MPEGEGGKYGAMEPRSSSSPSSPLRQRILEGLGFGLVGAVPFAIDVHPGDAFDWFLCGLILLGTCVLYVTLTSKSLVRHVLTPGGKLVFALVCALIQAIAAVHSDFESWYPVFLAGILSFTVLTATGYWRLWLFWKRPKYDQSVKFMVASTAVALFYFVFLFAVGTSHLYVHEAVAASKASEAKIPDAPLPIFAEDYLWHFFDAIPALEIPQTLNWSEPVKLLGPVSGIVLLTFKLLVILPIVGLVTELIKQRREASDAARGEG